LHETIGIPKAINAGNWLYFFPLESIQSWGLTPQKEVEIYRACHRALLDAHLGQALDLGLRIDEVPKEDVSVICQYSARWKSGALTALALEVGAILGEVPNPVRSCLCEFGLRFGESLQNFDDIGNVSGGLRGRIVDPKRFEDLRLRRPTFVWSILARHADANEYQEFLKLLNGISDFTGLEVATIEEWWRVSRFQSLARLEAVENLKEAMAVLSEDSISRPALQIIEKLNSILMEAYG
jgi:geranylgeranyl pyrophosphate synthase